ncbi:MAG: MFS transporter [Methanomicrobiales archaeon]|nr:MFS transporter [Methanomicrobiales archaeon]
MDRLQKIRLSVLVLGTLMGALDSTIVILAFPVIAEKLNADILTTMWVILIYLLIVAALTVQLGRLGDIFGRTRMFNLGFGIFTASSFFCGISATITALILFRGVQAMGGALMEANSGAIIADIFPPGSRGAAFGYNSLGWTVGATLGIVLGGVITTFIGWEYIFFINVPIGIAALYLGTRYLKDVTRTPASLDIIGMALLTAGLALISYAAVDFAGNGLTELSATLALLGFALILIFVWHETHTKTPTISFESLKEPILKYSLLAAFLQSLGYIAVVFLITMYLQGIRGLTPLDAALLLTPGYVMGSVLGPYMGRLSDRVGARIIATIGTMVIAVAILIYMAIRVDSSLTLVLLASFISGIGTAMFYPANNSAIMAHARMEDYGSVSGALRMVQNIGVLGSFVLAITVASASIPRALAFEIFTGTSQVVGHVAGAFIQGIDAALVVSFLLLLLAGAMSWARGSEHRDTT